MLIFIKLIVFILSVIWFELFLSNSANNYDGFGTVPASKFKPESCAKDNSDLLGLSDEDQVTEPVSQ